MMQPQFRIEKDFLGAKQVPADAYYGVQTMRAIENFPITGYRIHESMVRALGIVKKAAALANMEVGRLQGHLGAPIVEAAGEVMDGVWDTQFIVDPIQGGAGTSINMNANEVIANRALELMGKAKGDYFHLNPNVHVNMAQSTNDVFPTAIHIAALSLVEMLEDTMERLQRSFENKAREFDHIIKMGRTHLQDAVPIRLGQEFAAYARVLGRDLHRVRRSKELLHEINMGATAIGTGLNADVKYMDAVVVKLAEISGMPLRHAEDLVDATQNTDAYTELSGALKICMINLSKVANDIRLLASGPRAGLAELKLPERQPGSSIMPGKVNPVMCEVVNQTAFQVIGNDHTISLASEAGQLELNVMEPVLVFNLLQSISIMNQALTVFRTHCIDGIEANEANCAEYVERSVGVITALSPYLGYEICARIAREAMTTGRSVRDLCLMHNVLSEEELDIILNPFEMTKPGIAGSSQLTRE
ncbi:aspartate ammonia-lyase [Saccharibacillus sacchari]|uniref:aspartate ammonia-lyase n=1 Tax=Saccharibacillus sacchari TaxID=456493 RepID=UPI00056BFC07|nr:aspartate ammonia-lyase [Saccharibacillus sacchari]